MSDQVSPKGQGSHAEDDAPRPRDISIVQPPPPLHLHPLLQSLPQSTLLPIELVDILNHTYFLHLLATDQSKVIPPGKSLLSMMSKPHARERREDDLPTLQEKVEEVIHRAFWDEVHLSTVFSIGLLMQRSIRSSNSRH